MSGSRVASGAVSGAASGAAIGGPWGALIGGAIGGIGGALSPDDVPTDQFNNIAIPDLVDAAKKIQYQKYMAGDTYNPQLLSRQAVEDSLVNQINENPENKQKQQVALNAYQQLMNNGLGGSQGKLDLETARTLAAQDATARNASLMQKFQQMGQGPASGASLAAQLASNQNSNQNEYMQNLQASANAANARQGAIGQYAQLASGIRGQDYNTLAANTAANNQARMFDIANSTQRDQGNKNMINMGNMANINRSWQQQDRNVDQYNNQQNLGFNALQQNFANHMGLANAQYGAANNQNQANAQNFSNITGGITQAAGAYGQYQNNQDQLAAYNNRTNAITSGNQINALNNMRIRNNNLPNMNDNTEAVV
jgi:hypothetical protein